MALADNWHLRSRGRECTATQTPFQNGETIVTAIFPDPESSGYVRRDFSVEGWKNRQEDGDKPFSFWRTVYTSNASAEKQEAVEKESAEDILRRLIEEDEDHTENTRYILAVMLERQKLLRETDSQRTPTGIIRVYEHRKTGEVLIVRDPDIPLSQIEAVQMEVVELLENNGRPAPPPEPEAPAEIPTSEDTVTPEAENAEVVEEVANAIDESAESTGDDAEDFIVDDEELSDEEDDDLSDEEE